jgi:hypothetical protein
MLTFVHLGHISRLMNGVNKEIFCDVNKAGQIATPTLPLYSHNKTLV